MPSARDEKYELYLLRGFSRFLIEKLVATEPYASTNPILLYDELFNDFLTSVGERRGEVSNLS